MATLSFKGKSFIQNYHLAVKYHELIPMKKKSLTSKVSLKDNLIIHGDNLKALKALLPTYAGKVKCIYIDPPYNTGSEWIYNDNVNSPMMQEWLGKVVDKEDLTRHDKWLCMMMPRLKLLRELLHPDGVIFVSIDYNEGHRLTSLMNEIFDEDNYRDSIVIRRGVKSVQAQFDTIDELSKGYENVLMYTRNPELRFRKVYEELDEEKEGGWNNHWRGTDRPTMRYELFGITPETGQWRWGKERSQAAIANYRMMLKALEKERLKPTQENIDAWYLKYLEENDEDDLDLLRLSDNGKPEHYIAPTKSKLLSNLWGDLKPNGSSQLKKLFGKKVFDNPKSVDLIKRLIQFATDDRGALILDSFAGSGTTAHAVMELNAEDSGNRKFILVECEDYADEVTAERVRRVIKGVPDAKDDDLRKGLGGSFSFFELGEPIELESILEGKRLPSYLDLARYVFYTATGDEFLPEQVDEDRHFIGESKDYEVYLFYKPDLTYLKSTALTLEIAKGLGEYTGKKKLVFAPTKYLDLNDSELLAKHGLKGIEYCQLPFEIYRLRE